MRRIVHTSLFKAVVSIGLHKGYNCELVNSAEILIHLQSLQDELIQQKGIYLGANCYESVLVLSGQNEPHVNLHFIDYPKFPLECEVFKQAVEWVAEKLMDRFEQNRMVIQFHDSTVMLELSKDIDPRIKS
jgi:hypothetical protein